MIIWHSIIVYEYVFIALWYYLCIYFFVFFRTYDALIGIVTHDFFNELSDTQIRFGMSLDERDKMFQTFVRNQYSAHLQEILLTMQNEYTDWQVSVQKPTSIREQVCTRYFTWNLTGLNWNCSKPFPQWYLPIPKPKTQDTRFATS